MDSTRTLKPKAAGQQLQNAERQVLISKLIDLLCEGYMSTNQLAKKLRVSRGTVERYRPLADEVIGKFKLDRNVIRNLQVRRTYEIIEQLMLDLKDVKNVADRAKLYGTIYKFSSHLALITGLNVETHVNIDPTKLVIIRSNKSSNQQKADIIDQPPSSGVNDDDLPQLSD